jgi:hypothetical protein
MIFLKKKNVVLVSKKADLIKNKRKILEQKKTKFIKILTLFNSLNTSLKKTKSEDIYLFDMVNSSKKKEILQIELIKLFKRFLDYYN